MPQESKRLWGVQLWLNMPAAKKMEPPRYNGISQAQIPAVREDGAVVRVISGTYRGTPGDTRGLYIQPDFWDVALQPGVQWQTGTQEGATAFVYVLEGSGQFGPEPGVTVAAKKHAALFGEGGALRVTAGQEGLRFLLLCGQPLHEPIAWGGPIVMNTQAELKRAFKELEEGTFIKQHA